MVNPLFRKFPPELTDRILIQLDPIDLSALAQADRDSRSYIYANPCTSHHVFHHIFLNHFDPPITSTHEPAMGRGGEIEGEVRGQTSRRSSPSDLIDWKHLVQRRIRLRQTLAPTEDSVVCARLAKNYPGKLHLMELYNDIFELIHSAIDHPTSPFLTTSSSRNIQFLQQLFSTTSVQFRLLHLSGQNFHNQVLFDARPCLNDPLVSVAAKLHTMYGLTELDKDRPRSRGMAREACYALSNNHPNNFYGPFMPNRSGQVNWAYLEALSVVVGLNLTYAGAEVETGVSTTPFVFHSNPNQSIEPTWADIMGHTWADIHWPILDGLLAARPHTQICNPSYLHPAPPWPPVDDRGPIDLNRYDWAGVEGKWLRVVCFLDYRDLHAYNFHGPNPRPRLDDHNEVVRLMTLDLHVVSIGEPPARDRTHPIPPGLNRSGRPPIFFGGTSASTSSTAIVHPPAQVRGCVSETPDGQVRWSVVSTFEGGDRWSSEGIQVGGVRARWGIVGVWTDVNREDVEGPAGPFYFFKAAY